MKLTSRIPWTILILLLINIILSCTKKTTKIIIIEPDPDPSFKWESYYVSNGNIYNFFTNSYTNNDLYIASQWKGLRRFYDLNIEPEWIWIQNLSVGYEDKPYVHEKFTVIPVRERNFLEICSNSIYGGSRIMVNINSFGEEFSNYYFRRTSYHSVAGATNNQNRYITTMSEGSQGGRKYIVYFDLEFGWFDAITLRNQGYWDVESMHHDLNGVGNVDSIYYFQDKFYIAYHTYTYNYLTISDEGIINEYIDPFGYTYVVSFFTYKDHLFVSTSDTLVRYSTDGVSWHPSFRLSGFMGMIEIEDYLFMYTNDRIFLIEDLLIDSIKTYELPVANMAGVQITSIKQFKEYIVITTSNGIYYKSIEEAIKEKKIANFSNTNFNINSLF